ncbi:unnamed protein product [Lepidochelys kempii]
MRVSSARAASPLPPPPFPVDNPKGMLGDVVPFLLQSRPSRQGAGQGTTTPGVPWAPGQDPCGQRVRAGALLPVCGRRGWLQCTRTLDTMYHIRGGLRVPGAGRAWGGCSLGLEAGRYGEAQVHTSAVLKDSTVCEGED